MCGAAQIAQLTSVWWTGGSAVTRPGEMGGTPIYCNNPTGALAPYDGGDVRECRLDDETWTETVSTMLDAVMHTMAVWNAGNATQSLWVDAESVSRKKWWIQLVIPGSTVLLFAACVFYSSYFIPDEDLKELTLFEIISASRTQYVQLSAQQAGLTNSTTVGAEYARVPLSDEEN
jgi:succinate dehydrogenase hydrophobic anchor subunit